MGKSCQSAQSDCGRNYSQGIDLCLNEGENDAIISLNWGIGKRLSVELTENNKPEYGKKGCCRSQ